MTDLLCDTFDSPCGMISIVFDHNDILLHLDFPDQGDRQTRLLNRRFNSYQIKTATSNHIKKHVLSYLDGNMASLDKIACKTDGTEFQKSVWAALKTIACSKTVSYQELAIQLGNPKSYRAVARANALNPISLIYPCHRVIGSNGSLTGYAGGLMRKEWLLRHEGVSF